MSSNVSLAFHDIVKVEVARQEELWPGEGGRVQHIVLCTDAGGRHEITLFLGAGCAGILTKEPSP